MKEMSINGIKKLELLAPARNADTAIEAIKHGADAVYIGGPAFGARKNAGNSISEIRRVVEFAHIFRAKVYVTLNTILYDNELYKAEKLVWKLWRAGTDALIVQDMGLLRLDLPPIPLHASTQCDNRTVEKARFLEDCGFSQIVLARELSINRIKEICNAITIPVECFVHGALCVSYSGRCHASFATCGRSANRGECAQICRLPFDLTDNKGNILEKGRHLLSLKDFNASGCLPDLIDAGVSSFKIEGRLKDTAYVKNVTAAYSNMLDTIIARNPEKYCRSSFGKTELKFHPDIAKSFNRGFTPYFLKSDSPEKISSPMTPKSMGEIITDTSQLHNGDGISFFDKNGNYVGALVNGYENGRLILSNKAIIAKNTVLHRTSDIQWEKLMSHPTAERKIDVDFTIDSHGISASDQRGVKVRICFTDKFENADKTQDYKKYFEKLGNTPYRLKSFENHMHQDYFIPASRLSALRRELISLLEKCNQISYPADVRRMENKNAAYPVKHLGYEYNIANRKASGFYSSHGVEKIEKAMETGGNKKNVKVMTTRHCILRETGRCRKNNPCPLSTPLFLVSENLRFRLDFDCAKCEMKIYTI